MVKEDKEVQPSEAKSRVAQLKSRDPNTGQFLSPEQIQQVTQQRQAVMVELQRQKMAQLFGKTNTPTNPVTPNIPSPQSNFESILAANKPGRIGGDNIQLSESDKWDTFLGKKKSNIRW